MSEATGGPADHDAPGPGAGPGEPPTRPGPSAPSWTSPSGPGAASTPPGPPAAPPPPRTPAAPAAQPPPPAWGPVAPPPGPSPYPPPAAGLPGVAGWGAVPAAPKPGVVPLRPLGVGEILDGAVSYVRRDPRTVLGISAVIALVTAALQFLALAATSRSIAVTPTTATLADSLSGSLGSLTASAVDSAVGWVLGVVATGLLTVAMGQAVLGRRVTAAQAWARTSSRLWGLLGLAVVRSLAVGGVAAVGVLVAVLVGLALSGSSTGAAVAVGVLLGLAGIAAAVWVDIRLLLAPVSLILEGAGITTAMRRSWALVAGAWWRTFGIYVLGSVIAAVVTSVLAIPFTVVGALTTLGSLESGGAPSLGYMLSVSLATLVSSTLVVPFTSGVVALLYVDRRIRREALDLELARAAGVPGARP
jgi:hypothetical protein